MISSKPASVSNRILVFRAIVVLLVLAIAGKSRAAICLEEAFGSDVTCSANDISTTSVSVTSVIDGCGGVGDTMTFNGKLNVQPPSATRYDVGFYIGKEPESSTNDDCFVGIVDPTVSSVDGDACGDTSGSGVLQVAVSNVTVPCEDADVDGFADVNTCTSWRNSPGDLCTGPADATPDTKSRCNCQSVATDIAVPAREFFVNSTVDATDLKPGDGICADASGACTIRAAVRESNSVFSNDTIHIPAGTYFFTTRLTISSNMKFIGAGADKTILDGSGVSSLLFVNGGTSSASGLTLQHSYFDAVNLGTAVGALTVNPGGTFTLSDSVVKQNNTTATGTGQGYGGGIANHANLTLSRVVVAENTATLGGGIFSGSDANTIIDHSEIRNNTAVGNANATSPCGGGIWIQNGAIIADSSIHDNRADRGNGNGCGGAIYNAFGSRPLRIDRSLIDNNGAAQSGALQNVDPGVAEITNSTFSRNYSIGGFGAAIGNIVLHSGAATMTFNNCTIAGHVSGLNQIVRTSGSGNLPATTKFKNTVVDNPGKTQCKFSGTNSVAVSLDYNLMSDSTCFTASAHDLLDASSDLEETLADNGGPTKTFRPLFGSQVLNAIPPASCTTAAGTLLKVDQRGATRPAGGACERGSVEQEICGDGKIDGSEQCDDGNAASGDCCSSSCQLESAGSPCGSSADTPCDDPDTCNGSGECRGNLAPATTVCRAVSGSCDIAEKCTGTSAACPANVMLPSTVVCRPAADTCDVAERCTGNATACPANAFAAKETPCGDTVDNVCNHADTCNGTGSCSANFAPDGAACDDQNVCSLDRCVNGNCESTGVANCPLVPEDQATGDEFGMDVALSSAFLVVGAPASQNSTSGRVHVFASTDDGFVERTQTDPVELPFRDPDEVSGNIDFGASVAIDANTVVAGAPFDEMIVGDKVSHGSASVFFFDGESWSQQGKLVDASGLCGQLGTDVAISGNTIVLGAPAGDCVLVFERSDSHWTLSDTLNAPSAGVRFGQSVDISGDSMLVGAPGTASVGGCSDDGAVLAYRRAGATWDLEDTVDEPETSGKGACFGVAVALDGATGVVGAPFDDSTAKNAGSAYVIERANLQWEITSQLLANPPQAEGDAFGSSVDLRGDVILVGAPGVSAYLFHRLNEPAASLARTGSARFLTNKWDLQRIYTPPPGSEPELSKFAFSVAVDTDDAAVGAPGEAPDGIENAGAVYPGDSACGDGLLAEGEGCDDGDALFSTGQACSAQCSKTPCGDPDGSGGITSGDALFALRAAVGTKVCALSVCDVNKNGSVTAVDAQVVLKKAVGLTVALRCP